MGELFACLHVLHVNKSTVTANLKLQVKEGKIHLAVTKLTPHCFSNDPTTLTDITVISPDYDQNCGTKYLRSQANLEYESTTVFDLLLLVIE